MWQKFRWTIIASMLILLLGMILIKLLMPPLPVVKLPKNQNQDWQIARVGQADASATISQLIGRTIWGESAAGAASGNDKPLTPPDWRIAAVIKTSSANQLVITFNDNPSNLQTLNVGDKLPGGYPIVRIEQNWIVLSINGKQAMLAVGRN
ncbi:hypothetical protein RGU72_17005 [Undibacterium sp. 5I1]|uniref:hypothetical protein n=1 Tax=unclassified Undibacterium TaxID=2630295 RepID=UPI002AB58AB1|nr:MULTISPECIES: hypothetical protein [unclassified Undibacterium]MDY7539956.1 hypothetical protein [Undibacterium sp. 5I1]MEB0230563.1 hypothetical protein [Undibacterium sp. 10I3]MEB0257261.1 hypothetical protein [Undibacterium sp. 5I1]